MAKLVLLTFSEDQDEAFFELLMQKSHHEFMVKSFVEILDSKFDSIKPQIAIVPHYNDSPSTGWGLASFLRRRLGTDLHIIMLTSGRPQNYYGDNKIYVGAFNWVMHHRTVTIAQLLHELDRTEFILHPKSQSSPTPLHILNEPHNDETVPQGDIVWSGYSGPHFGWQNDADYTPGWNGKRLSDMLKDGDYQIPSIARQPYARMRNTSSWQYVIDAKETIWVHSYYHHPDLVNGERVYGAGEMFIDCSTGEIVWINDASNSYRPDGLEFYPYLDRQLHKLGIRVSKTWQRTYVGLEG